MWSWRFQLVRKRVNNSVTVNQRAGPMHECKRLWNSKINIDNFRSFRYYYCYSRLIRPRHWYEFPTNWVEGGQLKNYYYQLFSYLSRIDGKNHSLTSIVMGISISGSNPARSQSLLPNPWGVAVSRRAGKPMASGLWPYQPPKCRTPAHAPLTGAEPKL